MATWLANCASAQASFQFVTYPRQVTIDGTYEVTWNANGAFVTIDLIRAGSVEDSFYEGTGSTFSWNAGDDLDPAADYYFRASVQSATSVDIFTSESVQVMDEGGSFIPLPTTATTPAASTQQSSTPASIATAVPGTNPTSAISTGNAVSSAALVTTFTFTSAGSAFVFTTTLLPPSATGTIVTEALIFATNAVTFTTSVTSTIQSTTSGGSPAQNGAGSGNGLNAAAIAGIVVGVLSLISIGVIAFCCVRYMRSSNRVERSRRRSRLAGLYRSERKTLAAEEESNDSADRDIYEKRSTEFQKASHIASGFGGCGSILNEIGHAGQVNTTGLKSVSEANSQAIVAELHDGRHGNTRLGSRNLEAAELDAAPRSELSADNLVSAMSSKQGALGNQHGRQTYQLP